MYCGKRWSATRSGDKNRNASANPATLDAAEKMHACRHALRTIRSTQARVEQASSYFLSHRAVLTRRPTWSGRRSKRPRKRTAGQPIAERKRTLTPSSLMSSILRGLAKKNAADNVCNPSGVYKCANNSVSSLAVAPPSPLADKLKKTSPPTRNSYSPSIFPFCVDRTMVQSTKCAPRCLAKSPFET